MFGDLRKPKYMNQCTFFEGYNLDKQKNEIDNQGCGVPTVGTGRTFDECMVRKHLLSKFGQEFLGLYYDDGIAFTRILSKAL